MTTLYGIGNCDKCRKALKWFDSQGISISFHDLRKDGLAVGTLQRWLSAVGTEKLLNRRSTTWRNLSDQDRSAAESDAIARLLLDHPTLIKRPLLDDGGTLIVGYDEQAWRDVLSKNS